MKTTQYLRQEKAIAAADAEAVRERWLWGLRLLNDPQAFNKGSSQLKPGFKAALVDAAAGVGIRLSGREIQYRMQAARAYPTEAQIAAATRDYPFWSDLREAGFPACEAPPGEPPADYRTRSERRHDFARSLLARVGEVGVLFRVSKFEPVSTHLKELAEYAAEMAELTERFAARDRERQAYLSELIEAAGGDLSVTWQDAHDRLAETSANFLGPRAGAAGVDVAAPARTAA